MPYRRLVLCPLLALFAIAVSCSGSGEPTGVVLVLDAESIDAAMSESADPITGGKAREFSVPTYDLSGQAVHPDVVFFPERWHHARTWLVMTPYAWSDSRLENPSILHNAAGGFNFTAPGGVTNPLVPQRVDGGYNSDPDLAYDGVADRLAMIYRTVVDGTNAIEMIESADGRTWSGAVTVVTAPNHGAVSPTIIAAGAETPAMLWYVDAGPQGCHTHATTVVARRAVGGEPALSSAEWSAPIATDLAQPGYVIWHIKVRYVEALHRYVALYVAFPADGRGCGGDDMFLATSADGVRWTTFPQPIMRHENLSWTSGALYRGTFVYHPNRDVLSIWFSAFGSDSKWRLGFVDFRYGPLLAALGAPTHPGVAAVDYGDGGSSRRPIWSSAP